MRSRAEDIEQRAAEWLARRDGSNWTTQDQAAFGEWIEATPAHAIAVARLEEIWNEADILATPAKRSTRFGYLRSFALPLSIAASLVLAVTGTWVWESYGSVVHRTKVGQHDELRLADGSQISLNTDTKVVAVVADGTREVWLDHGEAFFQIAHDRLHPFVVHAGKQVITVLGTKFTVRREAGKFRVAVLTGRVRLTSLDETDEKPIYLSAGATATGSGSNVLVSAEDRHNQIDDLAWRRGTVVFDRVTLGHAVDELNRYSNRKLVLDDPSLADVEIGGRFATDNVDSFAQLLTESLGLKVREEQASLNISR